MHRAHTGTALLIGGRTKCNFLPFPEVDDESRNLPCRPAHENSARLIPCRERGSTLKQNNVEVQGIQRCDLFFADLVKQDPGRAMQNG